MSKNPDFIGKFRVDGLLGRGAMGVVFRAHDPDIDRTVAIKLVRTDLLDGDERAHYAMRFRNEAKMVGRCVHPNIVGIHDFSVHDGCPFLVLEFVDGKDLGRTFRQGAPLDLETGSHVVLKVLDALAYAHGFGIIHRDIKPGNILITAALDVKVTDFGISRALASSSTMSSVLVGTPCYMSPEQCLGRSVDTRSDLFSLGCVLYEVLSGERAFGGPNYIATTHKILHEAPRPLAELCPDLPPAVVDVVNRALAKQTEDRFQTAAEMAAALRDALRPEGRPPLLPDSTVVMASRMQSRVPQSVGKVADSKVGAITAASLATIERRLAHYFGPIARIHLRRALQEARTPDELGQKLSNLMPNPGERERLHGELTQILSKDQAMTGWGQHSAPGIPPTHVDSMTKALTQIIGPIAPRLLQQAMLSARTPDELEAACVNLIDSAAGRQQFRKLLAGPLR